MVVCKWDWVTTGNILSMWPKSFSFQRTWPLVTKSNVSRTPVTIIQLLTNWLKYSSVSQASEKSSLDSSELIFFKNEITCHYRNTSATAPESEDNWHNSGRNCQIWGRKFGCISPVAIWTYCLGRDAVQMSDGLKGAKPVNQLGIWPSDTLRV